MLQGFVQFGCLGSDDPTSTTLSLETHNLVDIGTKIILESQRTLWNVMSFWKRSQDPEAVPTAVPPPESKGWWTRLRETAGMGDEPEEVEMVEPSLLQQVNQAATLNRTQVRSGNSYEEVPKEPCNFLVKSRVLSLLYYL